MENNSGTPVWHNTDASSAQVVGLQLLELQGLNKNVRSHGVMVSTLDSESSDPSSNLGGTYFFLFVPLHFPFRV